MSRLTTPKTCRGAKLESLSLPKINSFPQLSFSTSPLIGRGRGEISEVISFGGQVFEVNSNKEGSQKDLKSSEKIKQGQFDDHVNSVEFLSDLFSETESPQRPTKTDATTLQRTFLSGLFSETKGPQRPTRADTTLRRTFEHSKLGQFTQRKPINKPYASRIFDSSALLSPRNERTRGPPARKPYQMPRGEALTKFPRKNINPPTATSIRDLPKVSQLNLKQKKYVVTNLDWSDFEMAATVAPSSTVPHQTSAVSAEERASLREEVLGGDYDRYIQLPKAIANAINAGEVTDTNAKYLEAVNNIAGANTSYDLPGKESLMNNIMKNLGQGQGQTVKKQSS